MRTYAQSYINALGFIAEAVTLVEGALGRSVPLVLTFLAGFLGLKQVPEVLQAQVQKARVPIDKALDRLVAWLLKQGAKSLRVAAQKEAASSKHQVADSAAGQATQDRPDSRSPVDKMRAVQEAVAFVQAQLVTSLANPAVTATALRRMMSRLQLRTLTLIYQGQGRVLIEAIINPSAHGYAAVPRLAGQLTDMERLLQSVTVPYGNLPMGMQPQVNSLTHRLQQLNQQLMTATQGMQLLVLFEKASVLHQEIEEIHRERQDFVNKILAATHVPPRQYSDAKHWQGATESKCQLASTRGKKPGQFVASLSENEVKQMERDTLLNGDLLAERGSTYHAYKRYPVPIGWENGDRAYILRAEYSGNLIHSHPRNDFN